MFGFTGEPTDGNGLVYLRARHYNPSLGVFPSLDPLEDGNRYAWVGGNVINMVDPLGLVPTVIDILEGRSRYSCKCGWLDKAHIDESISFAKELYKGLSIPVQGPNVISGVRVLKLTMKGTGAGSEAYILVPDNALPNDQAKREIGLGAFLKVQHDFEASQSVANWLIETVHSSSTARNIISLLPWETLQRARASGFSEEDIPSDYIGFWLNFSAQYNGDVWSSLGKVCDVMDGGNPPYLNTGIPKESIAMIDQYNMHGGFRLDWKDWKKAPLPPGIAYPTSHQCTDSNWPNEFSLYPQASSGQRVLSCNDPMAPPSGWWEIVFDLRRSNVSPSDFVPIFKEGHVEVFGLHEDLSKMSC